MGRKKADIKKENAQKEKLLRILEGGQLRLPETKRNRKKKESSLHKKSVQLVNNIPSGQS